MRPVYCQHCEVLIGRVYPVMNSRYGVDGYEFIRHGLRKAFDEVRERHDLTDSVVCFTCNRETLLPVPVKGE